MHTQINHRACLNRLSNTYVIHKTTTYHCELGNLQRIRLVRVTPKYDHWVNQICSVRQTAQWNQRRPRQQSVDKTFKIHVTKRLSAKQTDRLNETLICHQILVISMPKPLCSSNPSKTKIQWQLNADSQQQTFSAECTPYCSVKSTVHPNHHLSLMAIRSLSSRLLEHTFNISVNLQTLTAIMKRMHSLSRPQHMICIAYVQICICVAHHAKMEVVEMQSCHCIQSKRVPLMIHDKYSQ
jgi:hypothetical protein